MLRFGSTLRRMSSIAIDVLARTRETLRNAELAAADLEHVEAMRRVPALAGRGVAMLLRKWTVGQSSLLGRCSQARLSRSGVAHSGGPFCVE